MTAEESEQNELRIPTDIALPTADIFNLYLRAPDSKKGALLEYDNVDVDKKTGVEGRFFKIPLGWAGVQVPNDPDWVTTVQNGTMSIDNKQQTFLSVHLEKGHGEFPQIIERPFDAPVVGKASVILHVDESNDQATVKTQVETPAQTTDERLFSQPRVERASADSPRALSIAAAGGRIVKLADQVETYPGLIVGKIEVGAIIDTNGSTPENSVPVMDIAANHDGIGQSGLGLCIAAAMNNPDVATEVSQAAIWFLDHAPKTNEPATWKQDMESIRNAHYVVTIDGKDDDPYYKTDVAGTGPLSAGTYPRVSPDKGNYKFPGLKTDGSLVSTLPVKVSPDGQLHYVADDNGVLLDASEISEAAATLNNRKTVELGWVLPNSQRVVGKHGTNVQLLQEQNLNSRPMNELLEQSNGILAAAFYRLVAMAVKDPTNPHSEAALKALASGFRTLTGK
jgi:hypothetical protein